MINFALVFRVSRQRVRLLLLLFSTISVVSANAEALSEAVKQFPKFNDDELWIITDKSNKSTLKDLDKRLATAQKKLDEVEKLQRVDTRDYADALFNFVELYDHAERWTDAAKSMNRLIDATKKSGGPMSIGNCYKRLAYYCFMQDKCDEAVSSANTSLELLQCEYDKMSLLDLQVLGDIYTRKGALDDAQRIYERMVALTEACKAKETDKDEKKNMTLNFAKSSAKLADIYRRQGKLETSEKYYRQGISVVKATIGTENAFLPKCMYGLGLTLLAEQKSQEAEALLGEALPLAKASFGNESGLVGAIMQRLNKGVTTKN